MNDIATKTPKKSRNSQEFGEQPATMQRHAITPSRADAMWLHHPIPDRFTCDGNDALENHLESICARVTKEVRRIVPAARLEGLLLAGGYGRGEGGVLREGSVDQPYNDLDFYLFVRGSTILGQRNYRAALHALSERATREAGLEVEFKVLTLDKLRRSPASMFYYDLVARHRWLIGDKSLLAGCDHHRQAGNIPLHEATRLLFNRCSGLLFSAERLRRARFGPDEADFVGRNLAKAKLALGDALLTAAGQYHWSCRERLPRLPRLATTGQDWSQEMICRHHADGVAFKLHPTRSTESRENLARQHAELSRLACAVWLHLEHARLGQSFRSPLDYVLSPIDKCPETSALRNRLVNLRAFGPGTSVRPGGSRYPRQRLFHALALLLWEERTVADTSLLHFVQRELGTCAEEFTSLVAAYEQLWHRFN